MYPFIFPNRMAHSWSQKYRFRIFQRLKDIFCFYIWLIYDDQTFRIELPAHILVGKRFFPFLTIDLIYLWHQVFVAFYFLFFCWRIGIKRLGRWRQWFLGISFLIFAGRICGNNFLNRFIRCDISYFLWSFLRKVSNFGFRMRITLFSNMNDVFFEITKSFSFHSDLVFNLICLVFADIPIQLEKFI